MTNNIQTIGCTTNTKGGLHSFDTFMEVASRKNANHEQEIELLIYENTSDTYRQGVFNVTELVTAINNALNETANN